MADHGSSMLCASAPASPPSTARYASLFSYLPRAVRSRIPGLSSLRRSYSAPNVKELAITDTRVLSRAPGDGVHSLQAVATCQASPANEGRMTVASAAEGFGSSPLWTGTETNSGIDWFTAETGLILVNRAYSQASRNGEMINASAIRAQHIHGLVYLLQAIPRDLEPVEVRQLQSAIPDELRMDPRHPSTRQSRGNMLSRGIAFVMLQCALFLSFLLPVVTGLSDRFLRYEREHQVVQKLLASSGQTLEFVGEKGLDMKDAIIRFGQGRVGTALWGGVTWVAEGIVQGISEGAGRSAVIVGSAIASRSEEL